MNATGTDAGAVASAPAATAAPGGYPPRESAAPTLRAAADKARSAGDQAAAGQPPFEQGPVEVATRRLRGDEALLLRSLRLLALTDAPRAFAGCVRDELAVATGEWERRALDCATRADDYVAIITQYNTPAGLVRAYTPPTAADRRELAAMWVAPWARGIGAGDALVDTIVAWARQMGARAVTLWVNLENAAARSLYDRHGFAVEGDLGGKSGDGHQWLRMTRALAPVERPGADPLERDLDTVAEAHPAARQRW